MFKKTLFLFLLFLFLVSSAQATLMLDFKYDNPVVMSPGEEKSYVVNIQRDSTESDVLMSISAPKFSAGTWVTILAEQPVEIYRNATNTYFKFSVRIPNNASLGVYNVPFLVTERDINNNIVQTASITISVQVGYDNADLCFDSDGGQDINQKGFATGKYQDQIKQEKSFEDYCISKNKLQEYYCVDNGFFVSSTIFTCANGCSDGACALLSSANKTHDQARGTKEDVHYFSQTEFSSFSGRQSIYLSLFFIVFGILIFRYAYGIHKDVGGVSFFERYIGLIMAIFSILFLFSRVSSILGAFSPFMIFLFYLFIAFKVKFIFKNKKGKQYFDNLIKTINNKGDFYRS